MIYLRKLIFFATLVTWGGLGIIQQQQANAQNNAGPSSYNYYTPVPQAPVVQLGNSGTAGSLRFTYWVVANYPIGQVISQAKTINTANTAAVANVRVSWQSMIGVTNFDILRLTTPNFPTNGACTGCKVTIGLTGTATGFTDNMAIVAGTYTLNPATTVNASTAVDNRAFSNPQWEVKDKNGTNRLRVDLNTGALNVASCVGCTPTNAPITVGTTPVIGGTTTRIFFDNAGVVGEYTNTAAKSFLAIACADLTNSGTGCTTTILSATTAAIGGGALIAGQCTAETTVAVAGAVETQTVSVSPTGGVSPDANAYWVGRVSAPNVVSVKVCEGIAATPTAVTYGVRVF